MACCDPTGFSLSIAGISLSTPAWFITDLWDLIMDPEFITGNVLIPTRPGRLTLGTVVDQTTYTLELWMTGEVDLTGSAYADDTSGFDSNLQVIEAGITSPVSTGDGTRSATLYTPIPGVTPTTDVKPGRLQWGSKQRALIFPDGHTRWAKPVTFDIAVPAGCFIDAATAATIGA